MALTLTRRRWSANAPARWSLIQWVSLLVVAVFVAVPLAATALGGFKSLGELRTDPFGLPQSWDPTVYWEILKDGRIFQLLWNSVIISSLTVVLTVITASMAAFVLAHIKFFGREMLMGYFLLGLLFPAATAVLPLFIKVRDLGLLDSYWGVILPQVAFGLGFSILLFRSFFEQLPKELFDAALIDGCGYVRIYWHLTLPLSLPIIATVSVFVLVTSWNNYLLPLVILNSDAVFPWPLGIMQYRGEFSTEWNKILAFLTLTILPAIAFFLLAQRYIVSGLTGGAIKG